MEQTRHLRGNGLDRSLVGSRYGISKGRRAFQYLNFENFIGFGKGFTTKRGKGLGTSYRGTIELGALQERGKGLGHPLGAPRGKGRYRDGKRVGDIL